MPSYTNPNHQRESELQRPVHKCTKHALHACKQIIIILVIDDDYFKFVYVIDGNLAIIINLPTAGILWI